MRPTTRKCRNWIFFLERDSKALQLRVGKVPQRYLEPPQAYRELQAKRNKTKQRSEILSLRPVSESYRGAWRTRPRAHCTAFMSTGRRSQSRPLCACPHTQQPVLFWALSCQRREFYATLSYRDAVFFLWELPGSVLIPCFVTHGSHPGLSTPCPLVADRSSLASANLVFSSLRQRVSDALILRAPSTDAIPVATNSALLE